MPKAKTGNTVKIHYTGTLNNGKIFDSSLDREPLEFTLGSGQVIPGFDEGVDGMEIGEKKTINIPCEKAYGFHNKDLVLEIDKKQLPSDINFERGQILDMTDQNGRPIRVTVSGITDEKLIIDANPPLAGEDLTFEMELVEIVSS